MTKTIDTLIDDMHDVILGKGGWDAALTEYLSQSIAKVAEDRFSKPQEPRNYLSLSGIGAPCDRKIWYRINESDKQAPLSPESLGTFFYGDLIEAFVIALAKAAGHDVQGEQDRLDVHGVKGHRDCVIDGMTVDVKSASKYSFEKFKNHQLRGYSKIVKGEEKWVDAKDVDAFGYISQLSSYVYAGQNDPLVTNKTQGAFLVVQKDRFKLCLDIYDFEEELANKEKEIESTKAMVSSSVPPARLDDVPQSATSPNRVLSTQCGYCEFRKHCWPDVRTFLYSNGPVYMTEVNKQPNVMEVVGG